MTNKYSIKATTEVWQNDYANIRHFFIYGKSLDFDTLMQRIKSLQKRISQL